MFRALQPYSRFIRVLQTIACGGCLTWLVFPSNAAVQANSPYQLAWLNQFGTVTSDSVYGVEVDSFGNIYTTGETLAAGGGSDRDAFITKFNPAGDEVWTRLLGTEGQDAGSAIDIDASDTIYISGRTGDGLLPARVGGPVTGLDGHPIIADGQSDAFTAVYSSDGVKQWTRVYGTEKDNDGTSIAVDADGNSYTVASFFSGSRRKGYFQKFDRNGQESGLGIFLGFITRDDDFFGGSAIDPEGNLYVSAYINENLDGTRIIGSGSDMAIIKFHQSGSNTVPAWSKQLGTNKTDAARDVAIDDQGNLYLVGQTQGSFPGFSNSGSSDAVIAKYDPDGNLLWVNQFGSVNFDAARAVEVDSEGNVFVAGLFDGDAFLAAFDPEGNQTWLQSVGSAAGGMAFSIAIDHEGSVIIAGDTHGAFDGFTNAGSDDAFIAKFVVPEPSSLALLAFAGLGVMARRRRS